jgi:hypothetical protein
MPGGIAPSLGTRLWAIHQQAALRPLGMIGIQPHFGPGDPAAVDLLAGIIRTAAPLIERTGVATAEEIGADTIAQRLTEDLQTNSAVFAHPTLLSALGNYRWSVTPAPARRARPAPARRARPAPCQKPTAHHPGTATGAKLPHAR